jgi:hypothetical protein
MAVEALVGLLGSREYPARQTGKENIIESNLVMQDLSSTLEIAVHRRAASHSFSWWGFCLCRLVEFEEWLAAHACTVHSHQQHSSVARPILNKQKNVMKGKIDC